MAGEELMPYQGSQEDNQVVWPNCPQQLSAQYPSRRQRDHQFEPFL